MIAYEILRENYWGKWKVSKRISLCRRLLQASINLSTFLTVIEIKKPKTCGLSMKSKPYCIKLCYTTTTLFWYVYYKATLVISFVKTVRFIVL